MLNDVNLSSVRRMASWVCCTPPAKSSIDCAIVEHCWIKSGMALSNVSNADEMAGPSGIFCALIIARAGATTVCNAVSPALMLCHCAAVTFIRPESPVGQDIAAARVVPTPDTTRRGSIRNHFGGGGTKPQLV